MSEKKAGFKPYLGLTFLIGFGFFTMGLMDILYDSYVPIFLGTYIKANWLIGAIMTLDNLLAVVLIPFVSLWSDNTRTRIGRRMPFIIVLLPLSAIAFSFIPYAARDSLISLILVVGGLNLFKQAARGPVVALMPDTIPGEFRSEANGVINTMGALGAIISTLGLARLMGLDIVLPVLGRTKDAIPFPIAGLFVVLATVLVFAFVRERKRDDAILALTPHDYCTGPEPDEDPQRGGSIWVFGAEVHGQQVYIKLKLVEDGPLRHAICVSFHRAEWPLHFPFRK